MIIAAGLLLIVNLTIRFVNKEQDKIMWYAAINSSIEKDTLKNTNLIIMIDAKLINNFNQSIKGLDYDSVNEKDGILSTKNQNKVVFSTYEEELLPDSISIKYFSVTERKFYLLSTKLPYEKIKKAIKKDNFKPNILIEILPKGKFILKIDELDNENQNPILVIETFTAKETAGDLDMLVYKKSLERKYNDYVGIENITDFSDLLENRYKWIFKAEIASDNYFKEVSINTFSNQSINLLENTEDLLPIPRRFYLNCQNKEINQSEFSFCPAEILTAFRTLNLIKSSDPIIIDFKLSEDKKLQYNISKGGKNIVLNDLYP